MHQTYVIWDYRKRFARSLVTQYLDDIGLPISETEGLYSLFRRSEERDFGQADFDLPPELAGRIAAKQFPLGEDGPAEISLIQACIKASYLLNEFVEEKATSSSFRNLRPHEE